MPQPSPYQHIPEASFIVLLSMLFSCDNIVCIFWFIYIALFFVFGSLLNLFYESFAVHSLFETTWIWNTGARSHINIPRIA